ncbi:hypothetical protein [Methylocystis sp. SC2]|uniref:hypothetical protein n=1 Tax=Methylocystis sp. (strain SC2) TaxID=187303 RepID=UPI00027AF029|nr:hypothetical protein [Methylocystis sp. SC2]CCJ07081.1 Hypothetical protein BN69_1630 [Methylocystis sp. SC2]
MSVAPARIIREAMIGHPMVGDPRFDDSGKDGLLIRRACQYAAGILKKRGLLPDDASHLSATWIPQQRCVIFWRDGVIATIYRIPDYVMDYDPKRALLP